MRGTVVDHNQNLLKFVPDQFAIPKMLKDIDDDNNLKVMYNEYYQVQGQKKQQI